MAVETLSSPLPVSPGPRGPAGVSEVHPGGPTIIDIRQEVDDRSLQDEIMKGLSPPDGQRKTLPTLLLYDEAGLKLFEKITYLDEYYLTNAEIEILEAYAPRMAERIPDDSILVELGSGNLRKINILLQALDRAGKNVDYYALDLDLRELHRTLSAVPKGTFQHVKCYGLHGTYDDGVEWLKKPEVVNKPKCVLSMGSSIGNFSPEDVAPFLRAYAKNLRKGDTMIIGIDACNDHNKIFHAYNDKDGVTHSFILNGLKNANRIMGPDTFKSEDWEVVGEVDPSRGCHQAFVSPNKDVSIRGTTIKAGEKIRIEHSYKYSENESNRLWETCGLAKGAKWSNKSEDYALHLLLV